MRPRVVAPWYTLSCELHGAAWVERKYSDCRAVDADLGDDQVKKGLRV